MQPYNLLMSSNQFTTYLSAYSVFLSSIAGVMIVDYYLVRKGYLEVKELYDARKSGPYFYTWGVNWRAYAALVAFFTSVVWPPLMKTGQIHCRHCHKRRGICRCRRG